MEILHCADLHIKKDEEKYCFQVLDEIIKNANDKKVKFLLFAGDVFDSYNDLINLKDKFREKIKTLNKNCEAFYLLGNHEYLHSKAKNPEIRKNDLGLEIIEYSKEKPYSLIKREGVEFLMIPHNKDYNDYLKWDVPEKENLRICVAHAQISGLHYEGGEDNFSLMHPDLFSRFKANYVAMGHIHSYSNVTITNNCKLTYPGSARIWRSGENGERKINLITIDDNKITDEEIVIKSSGLYRYYKLPLGLDGTYKDMDKISKEWGKNDYIDIAFEGIVDDENLAVELEKDIRANFKSRVLSIKRKDVYAVSGISYHVMAKKFLELWQKEKVNIKENEKKLWLKARLIGLKKIKEEMEKLQ
jgi:DNA repair exonuclease SbcCD nuclease subunit